MRRLFVRTEPVDGVEHLRKYVLNLLPIVYLQIAHIRPAPDAPHAHTGGYVSIVLWGGYDEALWFDPVHEVDHAPASSADRVVRRRLGHVAYRRGDTVHSLFNILPGTLTLVLARPDAPPPVDSEECDCDRCRSWLARSEESRRQLLSSPDGRAGDDHQANESR